MTMTPQQVLDAVAEVRAARGATKTKVFIDHMQDAGFRQTVQYTYDPNKMFGVSRLHLPPPNEEDAMATEPLIADIAFWNALDDMAAGTMTRNAFSETYLSGVNEAKQELCRLIVRKDMKAGINKKTIAKQFPDLINLFEIPLATNFEERFITKWPVHVEQKHDGMRCVIVANSKSAKALTRTGKPITSIPHILDMLSNAIAIMEEDLGAGVHNDMPRTEGDYVFDGEIVSGNVHETTSAIRTAGVKADDATFWPFDLTTSDVLNGNVQSDYDEARRSSLEWFMKRYGENFGSSIKIVGRYKASNMDEVMAMFGAAVEKDMEGLMIKMPQSDWERKRTKNWLKLKETKSADLEIVSLSRGEEDTRLAGTLGAIIVDNNGVEVNVGTGFSDALRDKIWNGDHDDTIGRVAEIKYHADTPDGSLAQPRFIRFRDDKDVGEWA